MAKTKLKPKSREEVQRIVKRAVEEAVDFIQTEIAPKRLKAQRYFDGQVDIGEEEGRSKVVATKVRDTVRQIKPSLMRVFLTHERPVEYVPTGDEDVMAAEQATKYAHYKFRQLGGFRLLRDAFHEALVKKKGYLKVSWVKDEATTVHTFRDLTEEQHMLILAEEGVEVLEHSEVVDQQQDPATGQMVTTLLHDLKISRTRVKGRMAIDQLLAERFFIDSGATNWDNFRVCGHREDVTVSDLVDMGFDYRDVCELGSFFSDRDDEEETERKKHTKRDDQEANSDPAMKPVTLTEAYMKIDVDGTGKAVLHRILLAGTDYKLLDYEPADDAPFADFEIDPEPGAWHGRSIADLIEEDQDAATSILRGVIDNVQQVNNPRSAVLEGQVNLDDLLNNEIGGVVRERVSGAVRDLTTPFTAGQTLPALMYLDTNVETKTGVTKASTGLDPDALQSTTRAAVTATISAAAAQVEVMAHNLAEGGMQRLFKLMLKLFVKNADRAEMMRLSGQFVPVDPRDWNVDMDMEINVGLGTGSDDTRLAALGALLGYQQGIIAQYGPGNGLVTFTGMRNTVADLVALQGYRNIDRYIEPLNPAKEQALLQQWAQAQAQAQQGASDPNAMLAQVEMAKVQQRDAADQRKGALEMQKAQASVDLRASEIAMTDDRQRDKMAQDLQIAVADLFAKYGVQMNTAQLKAEQAAPRQPGGSV